MIKVIHIINMSSYPLSFIRKQIYCVKIKILYSPIHISHQNKKLIKVELQLILIVKIVSSMYHVFPEKLLVDGLTAIRIH